ncbi:GDSL-type esterase/lipase family protein [Jiangella sp. DSM 45060]|uniref:SGNH/GDSL hydrolase family protein n=1 Tax=Jiangella sp. DSM 45060 TaxID=1798224 RepID=UPI00087CBDA1|nr:GDSL-type esterase/lipase family protein [Jiangella sp. DSM 45060]SDS50787.1 Lysophospholipase L1 [Jiangella sp. DSM 45060]
MSGTVADPRLAALAGGDRPLVWSFIGDSVTAASWHTWGARGFAELVHERLRELGRVRDAVVNTGVSGWRVGDLLGSLDDIALRFQPDLVVIGTGLNDTRGGADGVGEFRDRYHELIGRIRADSSATIVAQTPNGTPPTAPEHVVAHLDAYADVIRAVAKEADVPLVDHHAEWAATDAGPWFHWLGHGCHPNAHGHRAMARTLLRSFGCWDPAARTGRLTIP